MNSENVIIEKGELISNEVYELSFEDTPNDDLKISINSNCADFESFSDFNEVSVPIAHIIMNIENLFELGLIQMDEFSMDGTMNYYQPCNQFNTGQFCCFPFAHIIGANPFVNEDGGGNDSACLITMNTIMHTGGTGDILTIVGTGFGATPGKVEFKDADNG